MAILKTLLRLPAFEDEIDRVRARLVLFGLLALLSGVVVAFGWTLAVTDEPEPLILVLSTSALLHVACLLLLRRGRLRAAGLALIVNGASTTFLLLVVANGFYDVAMLIFPLVFLAASFLLGPRDYVLVVTAVIAGLGGILWLHHSGWYDDPIGAAHRSEIYYDYGVLVIILALTAIVPWVFTAQLNRLVARAQAGEQALRELNASLDARVAERTAALERTNRELEIANRELQTFETSLSHSLRTPLRHVGGYADILLEDTPDLGANERKLISRMKQSALKLGQMGDALLAFSRLNERALDLERLCPARLWRALIDEAAPAPERNVEWSVGEVPPCSADRSLLRLALRQLLDNALKFTSERPVARIEFGYDAARAAYYVRDNGAGLDMDYAGKLFRVFERLHSEDEFPGLGMGLATANRIIGRHGGQMGVESRMGEGATFWFTLPPAAG